MWSGLFKNNNTPNAPVSSAPNATVKSPPSIDFPELSSNNNTVSKPAPPVQVKQTQVEPLSIPESKVETHNEKPENRNSYKQSNYPRVQRKSENEKFPPLGKAEENKTVEKEVLPQTSELKTEINESQREISAQFSRSQRKEHMGDGNYKNRRNYNDNNKDKSFAERLEEEKLRYVDRFKEVKPELCFEIKEADLFSVESDVSLAHCVSADFRMGKGIATEFKRRFNKLDELLSQNVQVGGCAYIKDENRYVYYMVTKKIYSFKPYYNSVEKSLKELNRLCKKHQVTKLAMPMIGCGLDQLDWSIVSRIIDQVFSKSNIKITIFKFDKNNQGEAE